MTKEEFKACRIRLGRSQAQMAELFEVHLGTIHRWEQGQTPVPKTVSLALEALNAVKNHIILVTLNNEVLLSNVNEMTELHKTRYFNRVAFERCNVTVYLELDPPILTVGEFAKLSAVVKDAPESPKARALIAAYAAEPRPMPVTRRQSNERRIAEHERLWAELAEKEENQ